MEDNTRRCKTIKKVHDSEVVQPNLLDYEKTFERFSWEAARRELDGLPEDKGLNIAHEAVDRHANGTRGSNLAIRWLGKDGSVRDFSYADLKGQSNCFANVLRQLGINRGERVFVLAGRVPELYFAALGTWKNGSVFCPLFSAFGPEPVYQRLSKGDAKVLVTTGRLYKQKVAALREQLPQLQHILLIDAAEDIGAGLWSLPKRMEEASDAFTIPPTDPEDMATVHFTSGTTVAYGSLTMGVIFIVFLLNGG